MGTLSNQYELPWGRLVDHEFMRQGCFLQAEAPRDHRGDFGITESTGEFRQALAVIVGLLPFASCWMLYIATRRPGGDDLPNHFALCDPLRPTSRRPRRYQAPGSISDRSVELLTPSTPATIHVGENRRASYFSKRAHFYGVNFSRCNGVTGADTFRPRHLGR